MRVIWILLALCVLLFILGIRREHYVEVDGPGERPSLNDAGWKSKIDAQISIGASDDDYIKALQAFYDTVYKPARTENATATIPAAKVEEFVQSQPETISKDSLRQIILSGFAVDRGGSAAEREEKQLVTTGALKGFQSKGGSQAIEPKEGVDETWPQYTNRPTYKPSDSRKGLLPEGVYQPVPQTTPRREGIVKSKSTSWTDVSFYNV